MTWWGANCDVTNVVKLCDKMMKVLMMLERRLKQFYIKKNYDTKIIAISFPISPVSLTYSIVSQLQTVSVLIFCAPSLSHTQTIWGVLPSVWEIAVMGNQKRWRKKTWPILSLVEGIYFVSFHGYFIRQRKIFCVCVCVCMCVCVEGWRIETGMHAWV